MDWASDIDPGTGQNVNMSLADKKKDPKRGISSANGLFSHGPYFEWKHMVYINPPKILTGGKEYPADNMKTTGPASNHTNYNVARYAEALLLYAEACIDSSDEAKGLKALQQVQERSGSGKISDKLTFEAVMEEKQYELWFESCRFHDLVRWGNQGKVDLDKIFNQSKIHQEVPTLKDAFFTKGESEHRLYTEYSSVPSGGVFEKGRHEYFPFPLDVTQLNDNLISYGAWANDATVE